MSVLRNRWVVALLVGISLAPAPGGARAHAGGEESTKLLMTRTLPAGTGDFIRMVIVSYRPSQASKPHLHRGAIFAYVLEGTVISQLDGEEARTFVPGQSWYEPPMARHLVSKNASDTQPATLLVFGVGKEQEPIKDPIGTP